MHTVRVVCYGKGGSWGYKYAWVAGVLFYADVTLLLAENPKVFLPILDTLQDPSKYA